MKIMYIGVILCLCLATSLAWHPKPEVANKRELRNRLFQYLAAKQINGKYIPNSFPFASYIFNNYIR